MRLLDKGKMKTYVIIPLLNEEKNIAGLVNEITKIRRKVKFDLLLINDGSEDSTGKIIDELSNHFDFITSIHHSRRQGWAKALKTGFHSALDQGADVIMTMDGDFTHDTRFIPRFVEKIKEGADVVMGSRFVSGGGMVGIPKGRVWLSIVSNSIFKRLFNVDIADFTSGYRAYSADFLRKIEVESGGFQVNVELILKAKRLGYRIIEIPIVIYSRKKGKSSRKILTEIPKYLFFMLRIYAKGV